MEKYKPTASLFLDTRREKKGKYPLKLTIYNNPNKKRYKTEYDLTKDEWAKINGPKLKDENLKVLRIKCNAVVKHAQKILDDLTPFSFEGFEEIYYVKATTKQDLTLKHWFDEYIKELDAQGREGTRSTYQTTLNSLLAFKNNLVFADVTPEFLTSYEDHMIKNGKSPSTVGIYLRQLRSILNRALKKGVLKPEQYPFKNFSIPASRNIKKSLTDEQLKQLLKYKPKTPAQEKALDFWLLSYLCNGMNMTDIVHLKPENMDKSFLYFNRQKTIRTKKKDLRQIKVPLNPRALKIINKWKSKDKNSAYLFPVLSDDLSAKTIKGRIHKFIKQVNEGMEEIRLDLKFETKLGTYVARHSFSTRLMRKGVSTQYIKDSLGHSSVAVTENYLGDFADETKKEYANLLTDFGK